MVSRIIETFTRRWTTYHLRNAETVAKVVKWHIVVMLVDLVEPFPQRGYGNLELGEQPQLHKHCLHQTNYGRVVELVAIERGESEGGAHLLVKQVITDFKETLLHLLVFG